MNSEILDFERNILKKILRNKSQLEKKLKVKLEVKDNTLIYSGEEYDVYSAGRVLEAIKSKFPIGASLLLLEEDYILEDIPIKSETKKHNLERIRGRIIGKEGQTLRVLSELSECHISLHDNIVSIIGPFEKIRDVGNAVKSLIRGSKTANVYSYLEEARAKKVPAIELIEPKKSRKNSFKKL